MYVKLKSGWYRYKSLDELCKEQRYLHLATQKNFRGRKIAIVSCFLNEIAKGVSREKAYQKALETQCWGLSEDVEKINVDSRTTWLLK